MNPNGLWRDDDDRAGCRLEVQVRQEPFDETNVAGSTLARQAKQNDARVRARRMNVGVCKSLVRSEQAPPLLLRHSPDSVVGNTSQPLLHDRAYIVTGNSQKISNLGRKVLVNLDPDGHGVDLTSKSGPGRSG